MADPLFIHCYKIYTLAQCTKKQNGKRKDNESG